MRLTLALLAIALPAAASALEPWGQILPPTSPACAAFKPHELCFATPKDEIARAEFQSEPFFAIILKSAQPCSITEKERLETQALFPRNKVFSNRFQCGEETEENIGYTNIARNVPDKLGFLAVYAGKTLSDAAKTLLEVQNTNRFPGANVRKMQAILVYP